MKNTILAGLIAVSFAMLAPALPSRADGTAPATPTACKDGTTSSSTGKGTCSGHGGVQKAAKTTTTASPAAAASAAPAAAPAAAAKTSTCKDGTTSTSTGKGTCSSHGGVAKPAAAPAPAN